MQIARDATNSALPRFGSPNGKVESPIQNQKTNIKNPISPRPGIFPSVKTLVIIGLFLAATMARAERILLVPLDSRPAAGQFAKMISHMASVEINMPPYDELGRFVSAGTPDRILDWMDQQDYADVNAVVLSTDMIAYGGLIASRVDDTSLEQAEERLTRLEAIRLKHPNVKFYAFSAIMRLMPTSTKKSAPWRNNLGRYAEVQDRYSRTKDPSDFAGLKHLLKLIPAGLVDQYEETRQRDHAVQVHLVHMAAEGVFDYLILGQDDARLFGPHVPETLHLRQLAQNLGIVDRVYFCEGIDQHANILVSRALLTEATWTPHVRIVYSDPEGKQKYNVYESKPTEESLSDQIIASGAVPMGPDGVYDYTLYVNTPGRRAEPFRQFVDALKSELDQGFPVAVADINLGKDGTADPQLFSLLFEHQRMMRLLSFAGWNTAGNSMGTAIPAANVYLLARRLRVDPLAREIAQREFLLHRFVNDYAYHRFTRPTAYKIIEKYDKGGSDETSSAVLKRSEAFVKTDLRKRLNQYFAEQFLKRRFFAGTKQYVVSGITGIKIFLPWPRAYEVRLEFQMLAKPVEAATGS